MFTIGDLIIRLINLFISLFADFEKLHFTLGWELSYSEIKCTFSAMSQSYLDQWSNQTENEMT